MSLLKRVLAFAALFFTVSLTTVQTGAAQDANYPPAVQNIVANLPTIKAQADSGDPQAQFFLGQAYYNGWGVPKDMVESVKWVRKAADQGLPLAQYALAFCYTNGEGVPKDLVESVKWVRKAAEQGFPLAQFSLGQFYFEGKVVSKDLEEGIKWIRKAAEQGFPPAQFSLGQAYFEGKVISKDLEEAAICFRKAAEKGYAPASSALAFCYEYGFGVQKDSTKASNWYKTAVQQFQSEAIKGNVDALFRLGLFFYWGKGVEKDLNKAVSLFSLAAERGHAGAQYKLAWCYGMGYGVITNVIVSSQWYQKAAEQGLTHQAVIADNLKLAEMGVAEVQYEHGLRCRYGFGVKVDAEEAVKWLRKAAEQGYQPAIQELNRIMTTVPELAPEPDPEPAPQLAPEPDPEPAPPEPATEQTTQAPLPVIVPDVEKKPVSDNLDKIKKDEAAIRKFIKSWYGATAPNQYDSSITTFSKEIKDFKIISNNGKKATVQFIVETDSGGYLLKPGENPYLPLGKYDRHISKDEYKVLLKKVKGTWTVDKDLDWISDGNPMIKDGKVVPPPPAPFIPDEPYVPYTPYIPNEPYLPYYP